MKYCRHCGKEMQDEASVCISCGIDERTPVTSDKAYCRSCGSEMNGKAAVCIKCGMAQATVKNGSRSSGCESGALARSRDGKILAGVCSGLGKKMNINPWVFRAILIITQFFGIGFFLDIAYIIAIFALPYRD